MTYETYAILLVNHAIEYFTVHLKRVWAKQERVKFHWAAICHEIVFREKCKATWKRGSIRKKKKKKALTAARFRAHCYKHSSHSSGTYNTIIFKYNTFGRLFLGLFYSPSPNDPADTRIWSADRPSWRDSIRIEIKHPRSISPIYPLYHIIELWFSSSSNYRRKWIIFFAQSTRCTVRRFPPGWSAVCPSNTIQVKLRSNSLRSFFLSFSLGADETKFIEGDREWERHRIRLHAIREWEKEIERGE